MPERPLYRTVITWKPHDLQKLEGRATDRSCSVQDLVREYVIERLYDQNDEHVKFLFSIIDGVGTHLDNHGYERNLGRSRSLADRNLGGQTSFHYKGSNPEGENDE